MRKILVVFLLFGLALGLYAQEVDISDLEPRDLDPELLDVSDASFYFQGPVQIYVEDLEYAGRRYAAVLDYDGGREIEIFAPQEYGAGVRPRALDVSNAEIQFNDDGTITVRNGVIDGYRYAATLRYTGGRTLAAAGQIQRLGPGPEQRAVQRLQAQLADAQDQVEQREDRIEQLREGNAPVATLQDRLNEREQLVASLRTRVSELETRISRLESPDVPRLPQRLHTGFGGQSNSFGQWASPGTTLEQTDSEAKFAKTVYPVRQSGTQFTYTVSATAPDSGWVGYGLHFLAGDSQIGRAHV